MAKKLHNITSLECSTGAVVYDMQLVHGATHADCGRGGRPETVPPAPGSGACGVRAEKNAWLYRRGSACSSSVVTGQRAQFSGKFTSCSDR